MKVGTLVKIKEGTDALAMPENRMGIVVRVIQPWPDRRPSEKQFDVYFGNGKTLRFHPQFVEIISEAK
jgi:hypothetical protein